MRVASILVLRMERVQRENLHQQILGDSRHHVDESSKPIQLKYVACNTLICLFLLLLIIIIIIKHEFLAFEKLS